jgi:broad specificity phosphatase PhoE
VAETPIGEFELGGIDWQVCLASDMQRTRITAEAVFRGDIEHTDLLREAEFAPFRTGNLRLPIWAWIWMLRLTWLTGHRSQRAARDDLRRRVAAVADRLCAMQQDTLVVSHAGTMAYLSAELRRRGFVGPKLRIAKHATAYIYAKGRS